MTIRRLLTAGLLIRREQEGIYISAVGIVGYGSIGREVARLARAFGMGVLALKREAARREEAGWELPGVGDPEAESVTRLYPPQALHDLLSACDYVVLSLPLTPETRADRGRRTQAPQTRCGVDQRLA